jgi:hypothetical protein
MITSADIMMLQYWLRIDEVAKIEGAIKAGEKLPELNFTTLLENIILNNCPIPGRRKDGQ